MLNLPVFVGIDYHLNIIQVCVMNQQGKILCNQSVSNDPHAVFSVVAPMFTSPLKPVLVPRPLQKPSSPSTNGMWLSPIPVMPLA